MCGTSQVEALASQCPHEEKSWVPKCSCVEALCKFIREMLHLPVVLRIIVLWASAQEMLCGFLLWAWITTGFTGLCHYFCFLIIPPCSLHHAVLVWVLWSPTLCHLFMYCDKSTICCSPDSPCLTTGMFCSFVCCWSSPMLFLSFKRKLLCLCARGLGNIKPGMFDSFLQLTVSSLNTTLVLSIKSLSNYW